jgi:3'-5' exoribonuclease
MQSILQHDILTSHTIRQLQPNEALDACFVVSGLICRPGRDGRGYRVLTLTDGRGGIRAFAQAEAGPVQLGQLVRVQGRTRLAQGELEVLVQAFSPVEPGPPMGEARVPAPSDAALGRLSALVAEIGLPYRALVDCVLADGAFVARFCQAPASLAYHHAYAGGLLQHTVEVMEAGLRLRPLLPVAVDRCLLLTAGFFHDLGKADTYTDQPPYALTPLGRAIGHEWLGLRRLFQVLDGSPSVPPEASGRLLSTLAPIPVHHAAPLPREREVLATLDGLSVSLSRSGSAAA